MCHTKECNDFNDRSFKEVCICDDLPVIESANQTGDYLK